MVLTWTRRALSQAAFRGFIPFDQLKQFGALPPRAGVYIVLRPDDQENTYFDANPAGRRNDIDPTLSTEKLDEHWLPDAEVLYIGTATNIQRRVGAYRRNGEGGHARHFGGARLWQLTFAHECLVCWAETPGFNPETLESILLDAFKSQYGQLPFANEAPAKRMDESERTSAMAWLDALEKRQGSERTDMDY